MDLSPENKTHIDSLDYYSLLKKWRFAEVGDPWFQGETGTYWAKRMTDLRDADPGAAVTASKSIGWSGFRW